MANNQKTQESSKNYNPVDIWEDVLSTFIITFLTCALFTTIAWFGFWLIVEITPYMICLKIDLVGAILMSAICFVDRFVFGN